MDEPEWLPITKPQSTLRLPGLGTLGPARVLSTCDSLQWPSITISPDSCFKDLEELIGPPWQLYLPLDESSLTEGQLHDSPWGNWYDLVVIPTCVGYIDPLVYSPTSFPYWPNHPIFIYPVNE